MGYGYGEDCSAADRAQITADQAKNDVDSLRLDLERELSSLRSEINDVRSTATGRSNDLQDQLDTANEQITALAGQLVKTIESVGSLDRQIALRIQNDARETQSAQTVTLTVTGASDDLIEIEGDIREEFSYRDQDEGDLVAFSDGTVLRIVYTGTGVWRITPVANGTAELIIVQATEDNEDDHSDEATLNGDIRWVVQGVAIAKR